MAKMKLPRRRFLQVTASALAALGSTKIYGQTGAPAIRTSGPKGRAKNVIFLVADGMNVGTLSLAEQVSRYGEGRHSNWTKLYLNKDIRLIRALQETRSESALVTDSAAAGSAWGCGRRVPNRKINMTATDEVLKPIGVIAKEGGKAVGLVSTCKITHATPASFAANVVHRDMEDVIAEQYLERGIDVLLGGGLKHFSAEMRGDKKDLMAVYGKNGYAVATDKKALAGLPKDSRGILGLFAKDHLPYTVDQNNHDELKANVPTLSEMMRAALANLGQRKEGFLLQVEGGRVDHAGHANDAAGILYDQLAFDECIGVALDFQTNNPDTLIIVTTDHGTGGCNLNGEGHEYAHSLDGILSIRSHKISHEMLAHKLSNVSHSDELEALLKEAYSVSLSKEELEGTMQRLTAIKPTGLHDKSTARVLAPVMAYRTAVNWTTQNHTGELVEFCAWGPGSEQITPFMENWQVHNVIRQALAI